MKNRTKKALPQSRLIIEHGITNVDVENLVSILSLESEENILLIFRYITRGDFNNAFNMGYILAHSEKNVSVICEGLINVSGIIPILSSTSVFCAAMENTRFIIDTQDYFGKYVKSDDQNEAKTFLNGLILASTNLSEIELAVILNTRTKIDVNLAYKYGIINDIYRSRTVRDVSSIDSLQRFQRDSMLNFERCEREQYESDE